MLRVLCFVLVGCVLGFVNSEATINQDSYLNALQTSHQNGALEHAREDFDFTHDFNSGYDYQPAPPIKPDYGPPPPSNSYGPPPDHYPPAYGPPRPVYGPPPPVYGPPSHVPPAYYHPRETWLLDKFKFKLDLFTIGKILLKLIIFKKIVKFIALICLLLFLPKLKLGKDEEDNSGSDETQRSATDNEQLNGRINEVTNFALTAFETFSKKYDGCARDQIWCRFQRMFETVDKKYPYEKIVKLYLPDADIATNEVSASH